MTTPPSRLAVIDALRPGPEAGVYQDGVVSVRSWQGTRPRRQLGTIRTRHFDVHREGDQVHLIHCLRTDQIDDDLSGLLAEELFQPGWLRGPDLFERLFTGVVVSSAPDPEQAWSAFYRNTLRRVEQELRRPGGAGAPHGTVAEYAPVYRFVEQQLASGSVLEVGCCFGFLALRLASAGRQVTASDISAGTVALLNAAAARLDIPLAARAADATRLPWQGGATDNVLLIHLLEHLEPDLGDRAVAEAIRVARRRVVIAVPLEDEPDETWGHVRTVSLEDLAAWGAASGRPHRVIEHHGGWLIIDTDR
ncbi:mycofactocin oligosaccharide methyltransferase MftM [Nocardioides sp. NPDC059952]|uniref:mycofactocin oligosaccharide methyltransferase MftM n=1 Tax=Nocardioides sp. NPDC059952 TaxID=3347014 RepID=UPI00366975E6